MKIFTSAQIREADASTIKNEPISSVDLMERAASQIFIWVIHRFSKETPFAIFCGVGNNGGDGLVIARLLIEKGYPVTVFEVQFSTHFSADYLMNKTRLTKMGVSVIELTSSTNVPTFSENHVVIDAIFGSGLSKPVVGWLAELLGGLNQCKGPKISVDIASGLFSENNDTNSGAIFEPNFTLAFEFPKLAFMLPGNHKNVGEFTILPIGLDASFIEQELTQTYYVDQNEIRSILKPGSKFDHKASYGHALIIAGSYGKMGAAVLSASAAIKSGAGLVTAQIPSCGVDVMHISTPEIMVLPDASSEHISELHDYFKFSAIGIGPGLGQNAETKHFFKKFLELRSLPMVVDADALNLLAESPELFKFLPENTILTPHLGEWKRLQKNQLQNDYERLIAAKSMASKYKIIIVLKGANTAIISPSGDVFFNSTGNPGMATAGSGDVLTGIITGLLAQGYSALNAAKLGVYIHGLAGDLALTQESRESLTASSILDFLGRAFKTTN